MSHKKLIIGLSLILVAFVFSIGYYWGIKNSKNKSTQIKKTVPNVAMENTINTINTQDNLIDEVKVTINTNVIFKIKYSKSNDIKIEKTLSKPVELVDKTQDDLNKIFSSEGYRVESMNSNEVDLLKVLNSYSPNKYVLGIKGNYVAIFKTDNSGNMFIEDEKNDVTDISTKNLKKGDIDLLTNGTKDIQFETRDEAESSLEDFK
jgi:hypothetical protein